MNIQIHKTEIDGSDISREDYFNSLIESQEFFLELTVRKSSFYAISIDDELCGHCAIYNDEILTEFYIKDAFIPFYENLFSFIRQQLKFKTAYCISFHHILLACCLRSFRSVKITGYNFRDFIDVKQDFSSSKITCRSSTFEDFQLIREINEVIFENEDEIREYLVTGKIFIYYLKKEFIGFGVCSLISEGRTDHDIGMLVHPDQRRKGYGSYIINHLRSYCLSNGWRPICGCAADNTASKRALEKAGFISKYVMFEFEF